MILTEEQRGEASKAAVNFLKGKISDKEMNSCLSSLSETSSDMKAAAISAAGASVCAIFYWRISLNANGKSFTGNAGGLGSVGAGSTNGDIYLASGVTVEELQANTTGFQFNSTPVYLNINFFDAHSKYLGSFHGGGVGICIGTGGGSGTWS